MVLFLQGGTEPRCEMAPSCLLPSIRIPLIQRINRSCLPHSTIIYSKDHGKTQQVGTGAFDDTTESQVVEIEPGMLMLNCRYNRKGVRVVMTTRDMGKTWQKHTTSERALIEPGACMASLIDVNRELGNDSDWLLLFSNPDSTRGRNHITIKASPDRGLTWPKQHRLLLDEHPSAGYSCMSMIDEKTVGILYEGSQAHMTFQRIPLKPILEERTQEVSPPATEALRFPASLAIIWYYRLGLRFCGDTRAAATVNTIR